MYVRDLRWAQDLQNAVQLRLDAVALCLGHGTVASFGLLGGYLVIPYGVTKSWQSPSVLPETRELT